MLRLKRLLAACLLCSIVLPALPAHAAQPSRELAVPPGATAFQTDGRYVIWLAAETVDPQALRSLYATDIDSGETATVVNGLPPLAQDQVEHIAIDGGVAVWLEGSGTERVIRARRVAGGVPVTVASGDVSRPSIAGDTVTWWEGISREAAARPDPLPATLKARNIVTQSPAVVLAQTPNTLYGFGTSQMSRDWVVWSKAVNGGHRGTLYWQISAVWIGSGAVRAINEPTPARQISFDLAGDQLVYTSMGGVSAPGSLSDVALGVIDLRGGASRITGPHGSIDQVASDGRYVFWNKWRADFKTYDLWGYDPATDSAFLVETDLAVPSAGFDAARPTAAPGRLVWLSNGPSSTRVLRVASIQDLLPTARRPGATSTDQSYFAETGHTLGGSFRAFWERSGSLPVFGYPLSQEFIERTPGGSQGYTVQYFERQRYELHPENSGTPYEVLLGRLGAEALERQGIDWRALPTELPQTPHYFAATQHAVAPQFWNYWRGHGLEFGDRGVSEREALALWGYPLTEPQMETNSSGDTILTQWFERARFEYHPANPEPYKVLVGRLSADLLSQRGW